MSKTIRMSGPLPGLVLLLLVVLMVISLRKLGSRTGETDATPSDLESYVVPDERDDETAVRSSERGNANVEELSFEEAARYVLRRLDQTTYQGNNYDYWPNGGLQSTYDHLRSFRSWSDVSRESPVPVFRSGPHTSEALDLRSRNEFGHYHPEFWDWVEQVVVVIVEDEDFVQETRDLFLNFVRPMIAAYWDAYEQLRDHPEEKERLYEEYRKHLEEETLPEGYYYELAWEGDEDYAFFALLLANHDVNVVTPAVNYWFRREMDGTAEQVFRILDRMLQAYQ
ncbi:MAG: hypothetical protein AAGJ31_03210 [Verrucomicrobiota bacterium]